MALGSKVYEEASKKQAENSEEKTEEKADNVKDAEYEEKLHIL